MFVQGTKPRRGRPTIGATAVGLAVGAGALGACAAATAGQPSDQGGAAKVAAAPEESLRWVAAANVALDPPVVPELPKPAAVEPAPPAAGPQVPAIPVLPAPAIPSGVPAPTAPTVLPTMPPLALPTPAPPEGGGVKIVVPVVTPSSLPSVPGAVVGSVAEVTPSARPAKSVELPQSVELPRPDFNLRPADPGLNVITGGPAVPQPPTPGDTPMPSLPTRQLVMSAVFGAALAATPALAQDQKPMPEKKEQPADAAKLLEDIKKDVGELKKARTDLEDLIYGKADGKTAADQGIMRRLSELETKLNAIQTTLNQIQTTLKDPTKSTSGYATPGTSGIPGTPGFTGPRAIVRLVNDYPTDVSMMVNGRSHRLAPGEVKTVEVPAGSYTYELLHAGALSKTAAIKDGETVTLRVN